MWASLKFIDLMRVCWAEQCYNLLCHLNGLGASKRMSLYFDLLQTRRLCVSLSLEDLRLKTLFLVRLDSGNRVNKLYSLIRDKNYLDFGWKRSLLKFYPNPSFLAHNETVLFRRILFRVVWKLFLRRHYILCPVFALQQYLMYTTNLRTEKL